MKKTKVFMMLALSAAWAGWTAGCTQRESHHPHDEGTAKPGMVTLSAEGASLAGIKTERVRRQVFSTPLKAAGTVGFNQAAYALITTRVAGRVENVKVYGGEKVLSGQELLSQYSPEFLTAQLEFLQAEDRVQRQAAESDPSAAKAMVQMRDSAAARLRLMGLTQKEVDLLREKREPQTLLPVRAPFSGSVIESLAVAGSWLEAGEKLVTLADLSRVWVAVDIYERDLGLVRAGSPVSLRTEAYPDEMFEGRLAFISDIIDPATRTAKGRVEVANPGSRLKPGMFTEAVITPVSDLRLLVVPEAAVRKVEGQSIVFVSKAKGIFAAREVRTGRVFQGYVEILEGLEEGEEVVTQGSFDLKAELLKGTLEGEHE